MKKTQTRTQTKTMFNILKHVRNCFRMFNIFDMRETVLTCAKKFYMRKKAGNCVWHCFDMRGKPETVFDIVLICAESAKMF